jgi:hypothetical protein
MISDHVVFSSRHFAVEPDEDAETNPGIYGRALAAWVAQSLQRRGIVVERIIAEDFGRCVMIKRKPFKLWIACASLDGSHTRWQMFIALEQNPLTTFFSKESPEPELERLREHYRAIVEAVPGITEVEWQAL